MNLLVQFLLRLSFGLAAGMAITSSRQVTSGYFRNHLYVTLGLTTLAAMVSYGAVAAAFWYAVGAAAASYVGSVSWLYERPAAGKVALLLVLGLSYAGMERELASRIGSEREQAGFAKKYFVIDNPEAITAANADAVAAKAYWMGIGAKGLSLAAPVSSGLLLGATMAAMLLGHWYLNTPTMELKPLQRLILLVGIAVVLQATVCGLGMWCELQYVSRLAPKWILFLVLRWSFGLIGVAALAWMAWQTLKIPNTQSATGILYVAVIGTFVGETMSLLLSAGSMYPL